VSQLSLAAPTAVAASNSPNIAPAAPAVAVAVPNPFVGAPKVGSTINLPGNSGSQLVTTTFNVPPITPNVSQPSLAVPTAVAASNSPNVAPAARPVVADVFLAGKIQGGKDGSAGITNGAGGRGGAGNANGGDGKKGGSGSGGTGSGGTFDVADV